MILFGLNSSQRFWNPLVIVPPVGCESLAKLLLALERLCAACTPVEGMNSSGGVSYRAPDWLAPPTKQRPCLINNPKQTRSNNKHTAPQAVGQGCEALRKTARVSYCNTHTPGTCFSAYPCVFKMSIINVTLKPEQQLELSCEGQTESEWEGERAREGGREGGRSVCVRMKERASWGFNPLFFPDCYTSDSYCAKHSCLWGWCQFNVPQLLFSLTSPGLLTTLWRLSIYTTYRLQ